MSTPTPKYFKAWILFFLIVTIFSMVVGAVVGAIAGGIMGVAGVDLRIIQIVCGILGFLFGIPISYLTFRWTVSEFIVKELAPPPASVPPVLPAPPPPPAPTPRLS